MIEKRKAGNPNPNWKKGVSGNPSGKPKGLISKKVKQWKTFEKFMLVDGLKKFQEEMSKLEGTEYIDAVIKMMEYFKPKLARTEHSGSIAGTPAQTPNITINLTQNNLKLANSEEQVQKHRINEHNEEVLDITDSQQFEKVPMPTNLNFDFKTIKDKKNESNTNTGTNQA